MVFQEVNNYLKTKKSSIMGFENEGDFNSKAIIKDILFIETTITYQVVFKKIMNHWNLSYDILDNSKDVIETFKRKNRYKIVLVDIYLPILNGYDLTREIRKLDEESQQIIIGLSSTIWPIDMNLSVMVGMNSLLVKPVNFDEFYRLFHQYLPLEKVS